jgi:hypothetical protein
MVHVAGFGGRKPWNDKRLFVPLDRDAAFGIKLRQEIRHRQKVRWRCEKAVARHLVLHGPCTFQRRLPRRQLTTPNTIISPDLESSLSPVIHPHLQPLGLCLSLKICQSSLNFIHHKDPSLMIDEPGS